MTGNVKTTNKLLGAETITIIGRIGNNADIWYDKNRDFTMSRFRLYPDHPNGIDSYTKEQIDKGLILDPIIRIAFFTKGNIEHPLHRYITKGKLVMVKTSNPTFKLFKNADDSVGLEQRLNLQPKEGDTLHFLNSKYEIIEQEVTLLTESTPVQTATGIQSKEEAIKLLFPGVAPETANALLAVLTSQAQQNNNNQNNMPPEPENKINNDLYPF